MGKIIRFQLLLSCLVCCAALRAQVKLVPGKTVAATLSALQPEVYTIHLRKNEMASISLFQKQVSLYAVVRGPNDSLRQVVDDNGTGHKEVINIIADTSGDYKISVHWNFVKPVSGEYTITLNKIEKVKADKPGKARQLFDSWYEGNGPGAAVLVIKDNRIVFEDYKGYANLDAMQKIGPGAMFDLASVSKQFTAFAIAMLADRKLIAIEDDIRKYIPELPDYGKTITIAHLVHHTSGIRDFVSCFQFMGLTPEDVVTQDMVLRFAINQKHLKFVPGERYSYSNTNYSLLASLVARVTKQSFASWMKENVFDPLQMNATFFKEKAGGLYNNKVVSYKPAAEGFEQRLQNNTVVGSQGCNSNMNDLLKWLNSFNTKQLITPGMEQMLASKGVLNDGKQVPYAFGNNIAKYKGFDKIDHLGLFTGFRTSIARFPGEGLAVVYLSNDDNDASYGRATKIGDVFLDARPYKPSLARTPNAAAVLQEMESNTRRSADIPLDEYMGTYFSPELGSSLQIGTRNGNLVIIHPRMDDIQLPFVKKDDFGFVKFSRDTAGKINRFVIEGEMMDFVRVD